MLDYQKKCNDEEIGLNFEDSVKKLVYVSCDTCHESHLTSNFRGKTCTHGDECVNYTKKNNMDPGPVPEQLQGLTFIEEQLVSRCHPMVHVCSVKGLQYRYSGNVITFPQDVQQLADELPHKLSSLGSVLVVRSAHNADNYHDFRVRKSKVLNALHWLIQNHKFYKNAVKMSMSNIMNLPEDQNVYYDIPFIEAVGNSSNEDNVEPNEGNVQSNESETCEASSVNFSGVPITNPPHPDEQINATLNWPAIDGVPVNEFKTAGYIACAFPTLFPYGLADLRDSRLVTVSPSDYFKHLMRYKDRRFAQHKTFRFFAMNSTMRWTALTDGKIFVRNNPEFKEMTSSQLKDLLKEKPNTVKKVMYQASNLRGTKPYWRSRFRELRAMVSQLGLPTVFLTLSFPDYHYPDLYRLLTDNDAVPSLTESERIKLIRDNPSIVDEFFKERIDIFIKEVSIFLIVFQLSHT